ncbi:hypothetical protein RAS1_06240 [Phycisphaerae bacterium RAS1]|nr:hypothetical protein RAS1_06240 [Phycisphaerae bacterium RAS1]
MKPVDPLRARSAARALSLVATLLTCTLVGGCPGDPNAPAGGDGGVGGVLGGLLGVGDGSNAAPTASLSISPSSGITPATEITLDASGSSDPDGDELSFEWMQTNGPTGVFSATTGSVVKFVAPLALETSTVEVRVVVKDGRGGEAGADSTAVVQVGDEFAGYAQSTLPYRDVLTPDEAYHLLRRAAFGATPKQVQDAVKNGLSKTVQSLLTRKTVPTAVNDLAALYEDDMPRRWLVHLIESPNPLHERMAMFWHDRFATSRRGLEWRDRNLSVLHWEMLRSNALGNYRAFLEALTLDPLMLLWLNGADSPKDNPNENYTREFWELFTLGRDALYTEADIREGARAFTGITLLREDDLDARPIFDIINHDETNKSVFPDRADPANHTYRTVIQLTLSQPEAPRYVARNLFKCFIHDHPSDQAVQELADLLVESDFDIAPVVRAILTSQAFFSTDARGNQITSPVEHVVGVARTLDMHIQSEDSQGYVLWQLAQDLRDAGQDLMNPPGVNGWDEDKGWLQDQWIISRIFALSRTMEYGPQRTPDLPYHLLPPTGEWVEREVRDRIVDAMAAAFHLPLTEEEHDVYVEVLDQNGWQAFHLTEPDYQPRQVFELIRLMAMDERVIGR